MQKTPALAWDIALFTVSLAMVVLWAGTGTIQHLTQAEAIADELAPEIGADRDVVRQSLERILQRSNIRRVVIYCWPWAIMSLLLALRLVVDWRSHQAWREADKSGM